MSLLQRVFVERRAVVVPLTVFLVGNIAVLALVVWPLQRTVAGGKESQWQVTQQVAAARALEVQAKMDRAGKDRADIELRKFYTEILPKDDSTAIGAATFSLTRLADDSNVTFKVGQWEREAVKDSTLTRLSVNFSANGAMQIPTAHLGGAGTFYYQLWFRNNPIGFCNPTAAFNMSNGVSLTW